MSRPMKRKKPCFCYPHPDLISIVRNEEHSEWGFIFDRSQATRAKNSGIWENKLHIRWWTKQFNIKTPWIPNIQAVTSVTRDPTIRFESYQSASLRIVCCQWEPHFENSEPDDSLKYRCRILLIHRILQSQTSICLTSWSKAAVHRCRWWRGAEK
jgi:hypothetical protein